jgi:hypothetical protein
LIGQVLAKYPAGLACPLRLRNEKALANWWPGLFRSCCIRLVFAKAISAKSLIFNRLKLFKPKPSLLCRLF